MSTMDIWYAHLSEQELMAAIRSCARPRTQAPKKAQEGSKGGEEAARRRPRRPPEGAHTRQPAGAVEARRTGRRPLPDRQPAADRHPGSRAGARPRHVRRRVRARIHEQFRAYRATLQDDRRQLLERFEIIDMARKVVGVGSVGTRAFIVLLQGRDQQDPLFLQVKEATPRCWRTTCRRAATSSPASGSSRASG